MAFCTKCGSKLDDGAAFCPGCGAQVGAGADTPQAGWDDSVSAVPAQSQERTGSGEANGYASLDNVYVVSKPLSHTLHDTGCLFLAAVIAIFTGVIFGRLENAVKGVPVIGGVLVGIVVILYAAVFLGIPLFVQKKIRESVLKKLPEELQTKETRSMLFWKVYGFGSMWITTLRWLRVTLFVAWFFFPVPLFFQAKFPELGIGTDAQGKYHAVVIPGRDVELYPSYD